MKSVRLARFFVAMMGLWMTGATADNLPASPMLDGQVADRSLVCMIDDNLQSKPGLAYAYQGKTYYLCCAGCRNRFASDPARFSRAVDPISGESVDKAEALIFGYAGKAFFFSNEEHLKAFAGDPERYLQQVSSEGACEEPSGSGCQAEGVGTAPSTGS